MHLTKISAEAALKIKIVVDLFTAKLPIFCSMRELVALHRF